MSASGATHAFIGGRILSMDPWYPAPEVVVVEHGRIAAVGERGLLQAYPHASRESLGERVLLPGFIDAHNHLSIAALHPLWADLSDVRTLEALLAALRAQADRDPEVRWVRGAGWSEIGTGLVPDRHDLDALGLERPVLVAHYSLHQGVVCSRGLDELGIGRRTPDPPGGEIVRGPDGEPTGLLVERAWSDAHRRSLAASAGAERWGDLIAARGRVLLRDGITGVHDAACPPSAEAVYRALASARALPISVLVMPHGEALFHAPDATRLAGPATGDGDEWMRVGPVKLFADGGVAPAFDLGIGGAAARYGSCFPDLADHVQRAVEHGFAVAVHAIGNAALATALDAFDRAVRVRPQHDRRFRIEHAVLASPAQLRRMAALGVMAVVQPGFLHHLGALVERIPVEGAAWLAFGDMARAGLVLAASSDDPCAFHEPLRAAVYGATRRTGSGSIVGRDQAVAYEDWLRAYTAGAALAGGQEHERGSLTPGKRADLVVLEGGVDPSAPPRVVETWVAGERVHTAA